MADTASADDRGDLKSTTYEFFVLAMAILSIANLPLLLIFPYESQSWIRKTRKMRKAGAQLSRSRNPFWPMKVPCPRGRSLQAVREVDDEDERQDPLDHHDQASRQARRARTDRMTRHPQARRVSMAP